MQLKSLKTFCDVIRLGSFSKAAELNGVSQSNVSQLVQQLESRLGVQLIDTSKRPFVVTREGQRYHEGCRDLVRHYDELERQVRALGQGAGTTLNVAAIYSVGIACIHRVATEYRSANPKVDLRVEYMHPSEALAAVDSGETELGVVSFPQDTKRLAVEPWRDEVFALAAAPSRAFDRPSVSVEDLDGEALVLPQHGLRMRDELDRYFAANGVRVKVAAEFDNLESVKRAVEVDEGVSLLPGPIFDAEVANGTLVRMELEGTPLLRPLGVVYRRETRPSDAARRFIDLLQRHADEESADAANGGEAVGAAATQESKHAATA